jgi:hypothetical protein
MLAARDGMCCNFRPFVVSNVIRRKLDRLTALCLNLCPVLPWQIIVPSIDILLLVDVMAVSALRGSSHDYFARPTVVLNALLEVLLLNHAVA